MCGHAPAPSTVAILFNIRRSPIRFHSAKYSNVETVCGSTTELRRMSPVRGRRTGGAQRQETGSGRGMISYLVCECGF